MANLSIVIVPAKKLSNGRHRVRIAVAHRSQTRYISTQFILDSANQMKNGRVVKHENAANINACLRKLINEYEEILSSIHYQSNISCTELIHVITREQQKKGITFNTVVKEYLSMMEADDRKKSHKLYNLKSATKPLNVLIAFTRPLITEFADNLNLKHPLLPTISPYPTM